MLVSLPSKTGDFVGSSTYENQFQYYREFLSAIRKVTFVFNTIPMGVVTEMIGSLEELTGWYPSYPHSSLKAFS